MSYWKSFLHSSHYIFPSSTLSWRPSVCSVYRDLPLTYIKSHHIKTTGRLLHTPCFFCTLGRKLAPMLQSADVTVPWFPWIWDNLGLHKRKSKSKTIYRPQESPVNEHQRDGKEGEESVVLIKGILRSQWVLLIDLRKMRPVCVRSLMNHHQNFTCISSSSHLHESSRSTLPSCKEGFSHRAFSSTLPSIFLPTFYDESRLFHPSAGVFIFHIHYQAAHVALPTLVLVLLCQPTWFWLNTYFTCTYCHTVDQCWLGCGYKWDILLWNFKTLIHISSLCRHIDR